MIAIAGEIRGLGTLNFKTGEWTPPRGSGR